MKSAYLSAAFVAGLGLIGTGFAAAQVPNTQASGTVAGTSVAVIDLQFIFENYKRVKDANDTIKREFDAFQDKVRETENALKKSLEELKALTPGTEPYKLLEDQIAQTRTQTQLEIARKQRERVESEAKIYHRAYQDISSAISRFADRNGIDLVLQINTTEIDPAKPETVRLGLSRLVVFQRNRDITQFILDEVNRLPAQASGDVRPRVNPGAQGVPTGRNAIPGAAPQKR